MPFTFVSGGCRILSFSLGKENRILKVILMPERICTSTERTG
jgi:hypothetical protein